MKILVPVFALLLTACRMDAASIVLYETGWEAAPADPAWAAGNVAPQNGWVTFNSAAGNMVAVNGTPEAIVSGQAVTTPYGTQFHRFTGSLSTVDSFQRVAWIDLAPDFAARPAGYNLLTASSDFFVPATQAADASLYGLVGLDTAGDFTFVLLVDPSSRSLLLFSDGIFVTEEPGAFALDTWFNLAISANLQTGEFFVSLDGTPVPGLTAVLASLPARPMNAVALLAQNSLAPPATRSIFTDNYRIIIEEVAAPRPRLLLERAGDSALLLSWNASQAHWILESTTDITAAVWEAEAAKPLVLEGQALVTLPLTGPARFFRLREP